MTMKEDRSESNSRLDKITFDLLFCKLLRLIEYRMRLNVRFRLCGDTERVRLCSSMESI